MSTNDRDIPEDRRWLVQQLDRVAEGVRNLQVLPLWAQAAHSMLTYNPESVLYQATR